MSALGLTLLAIVGAWVALNGTALAVLACAAWLAKRRR